MGNEETARVRFRGIADDGSISWAFMEGVELQRDVSGWHENDPWSRALRLTIDVRVSGARHSCRGSGVLGILLRQMYIEYNQQNHLHSALSSQFN